MSSKHSKEDIKNNKSTISRLIIYIVIIVALVEVIYGVYMLYEKYKRKFKNLEIEIGSVEEVTMQDFLKNEKYEVNSTLITNLDEIDYLKVGEYSVKLSHDGREEEVTLKLVDTTAPEVTFQDITRYIDYEINAEDFIIEKSDLSDMTVEAIELPEINEFIDYDVKVVVKDTYGNETSNICKLSIRWIKDEIAIERGQNLTKKDLLYNVEEDGDLLDNSRLKEISNSEIGDYEIRTEKDGKECLTLIKVTDLTPPVLKLRDVTIYDDEKVDGKNSFIVSATDNSGEVTTTLKTEINPSKLGTQTIVIEAVDKYGNKTEKTATLTIRKDNVGPVFSGLSNITISKGSTIDYRKRS